MTWCGVGKQRQKFTPIRGQGAGFTGCRVRGFRNRAGESKSTGRRKWSWVVTTKPRDIRQLASECSQIMARVYYVVTLAT